MSALVRDTSAAHLTTPLRRILISTGASLTAGMQSTFINTATTPRAPRRDRQWRGPLTDAYLLLVGGPAKTIPATPP